MIAGTGDLLPGEALRSGAEARLADFDSQRIGLHQRKGHLQLCDVEACRVGVGHLCHFASYHQRWLSATHEDANLGLVYSSILGIDRSPNESQRHRILGLGAAAGRYWLDQEKGE